MSDENHLLGEWFLSDKKYPRLCRGRCVAVLTEERYFANLRGREVRSKVANSSAECVKCAERNATKINTKYIKQAERNGNMR